MSDVVEKAKNIIKESDEQITSLNDFAFLEYIFIFEPNNTWPHLFEFEQDLAKFFRVMGKEAVLVKTLGGQSGRRILLIKNKEDVKFADKPEGKFPKPGTKSPPKKMEGKLNTGKDIRKLGGKFKEGEK